jgi:hypothetical protein
MRYLLLSAFGLFLLSCNNKEKNMLCKTWQVSDVQFLNEKETLVQSDTMQGNQQEVAKTILKELLMKNIYEFKADGSYMTGNAAANAEGQWELKGDAIRFIGKEGKEKLVPIAKLQNDTLILLMQKDQTSLNVKLIMTPLPR